MNPSDIEKDFVQRHEKMMHDEMVRRGALSYKARIKRHGTKKVLALLSKAGKTKKRPGDN